MIIKSLLKNNKEFSDEIIKKILNSHNQEVELDSTIKHVNGGYEIIKFTINNRNSDSFLYFKNGVNDLVHFINLEYNLIN